MQTVLLVGSGRLAQHLVFWNSLSKNPSDIITWNRKENSLDDLKRGLTQCQLIWLAISDSALVSFYEQHFASSKNKVVHFSGAIDDKRLIAAHPLMSFPSQLMAKDVYPRIHFVLSGIDSLKNILPSFSNSFSKLDSQHKAFYHALCVMAGNFPQLLWSEVFPEFQNLGIPETAVETYIQQITANFIQLKHKSLTGPLIRKDLATIEKNLQSLEKSKLKKIYESFVGVFTR